MKLVLSLSSLLTISMETDHVWQLRLAEPTTCHQIHHASYMRRQTRRSSRSHRSVMKTVAKVDLTGHARKDFSFTRLLRRMGRTLKSEPHPGIRVSTIFLVGNANIHQKWSCSSQKCLSVFYLAFFNINPSDNHSTKCRQSRLQH